MSFPFPQRSLSLLHKRASWIFCVGSHLEVSQWIVLPLGLVLASFPLSCLQLISV